MAKQQSSYDRVQNIYSSAWDVFTANWQIILALVAIPLLLDLVMLSTVFSDVQDEIANTEVSTFAELRESVPDGFLPYVMISLIVGLLLTGSLITTLFKVIKKKKVSLSEALGVGLERFWDVFSASIIIGLIVVTGLIFLILPGIIAGFFLLFTLHARLEKQRSISDSIRLSAQKVRKHWAETILIILGFVGITVAIDIFSQVVTAGLNDTGVNVVYTALSIPVSAFMAVVFTKAYVDFKVAKPKKTE